MHNEMVANLNIEQSAILNELILAVSGETMSSMFFIDAPGGTGKTYLLTCFLHYLKGHNINVAPTAYTGIASLLLEGGRTCHKWFGLPVPVVENSISQVKANSAHGHLLRACKVIIWDEAPMASNLVINCVDSLLQDLHQNNLPFGGKVVVFSGDFRQVLPVVKHGNRTAIVEQTLKKSRCWHFVKVCHLTENMRVGEDEFAHWVLKLSNGELPSFPRKLASSVELPSNFITLDNLVDEIYGVSFDANDVLQLTKKVILSPLNDHVDKLNQDVLGKIRGEFFEFELIDEIVPSEYAGPTEFPTEFLNSLTPSNLPPHVLRLKVGAVIMLMRNLNAESGLVNGMQLQIKEIRSHCLICTIITGEHVGNYKIIPMIKLTLPEDELPFVFLCKQFPV